MANPRGRAFAQVDVFTAEPLYGNPVAVVLDAEGLTAEQMQRLCDWTNLSEVTFVLPPTTPEADYRVRIFCPGRELPFAGHPTLGTCHAWLEHGGTPQGADIVQECGAGLVPIRRDGDFLSFAAPDLVRSGPLADDDLDRLVAGLGISRSDVIGHQWCDNGPPWQAVLLGDDDQVRALAPDPALLAGLFVGVIAPAGDRARQPSGDSDFQVRAFFPGNAGLTEDPVTGSLNAALAQWLIPAGIAPQEYVAAQGTVLGRAGRVRIRREGNDTWVGGASVTVFTGTFLTMNGIPPQAPTASVAGEAIPPY